MTIALTGTGGLFTRLGRLGKILNAVNVHELDLITQFEALFVQYDGVTPPGLRDVENPIIGIRPRVIKNQGSWLGQLTGLAAQQTLMTMVFNDVSSQAGSVFSALSELIRQMKASADSVKASTVESTATAGSANLGDGAVALSNVRAYDGLSNEVVLPESARLVVESTTVARYTGAVGNPDDVNSQDWPAGSGASNPLTIYTIDSNSLLANGDFETFSVANTPDSWTIEAGAAGTQIFSETGTFYTGAASMKWPGNATGARIAQAIDTDLAPLTAYCCVLWARVSGVPAAGVLTLDFTDSGGTVINDAAGNANSLGTSLPGFTANTWTQIKFVFRTGRTIPSGAKLRIRLSTALSVGTNLFLDRAILVPMAPAYLGGPLLAVFQGATVFPVGDYFTIATTNNRGGATNNATFQALFDRMFNLRSLGLLLPSSGSPTIADTLITT